jgi:hypothetical protein
MSHGKKESAWVAFLHVVTFSRVPHKSLHVVYYVNTCGVLFGLVLNGKLYVEPLIEEIKGFQNIKFM